MNKKYTAFFSSYGMEVSGNWAYGKIKGYETNATITVFDNVAPTKIHISFYATDMQKRNIEFAIRNLALKFFTMRFTPYGLMLGFNDITLNHLLKRLPSILDTVFRILSENGALTSEFCPVCGKPLEEGNIKKCNIDGFSITIDNACVDTINSVISAENQDFINAPNNYLYGFLGALLGGLVGAASSILFYMMGFVSALSAIISIALGTFLYRKFHGKPNKGMIAIVSMTTLVLMAATIPAIYITASWLAARSEGLYMSALEAFNIVMYDSEVARAFYTDLALVVVFSLIGIVLEIVVLSKKIKRQKNI